jgi:hypothetical protein
VIARGWGRDAVVFWDVKKTGSARSSGAGSRTGGAVGPNYVRAPWLGFDPPLEGLAVLAEVQSQVVEDVRRQVSYARTRGHTWAEVAAALGEPLQTVYSRYRASASMPS